MVCKIMAFMAIIMGLGLSFYILLEFRVDFGFRSLGLYGLGSRGLGFRG